MNMSNIDPFRTPLLQLPSPLVQLPSLATSSCSRWHQHDTNRNLNDLESSSFPALQIAATSDIMCPSNNMDSVSWPPSFDTHSQHCTLTTSVHHRTGDSIVHGIPDGSLSTDAINSNGNIALPHDPCLNYPHHMYDSRTNLSSPQTSDHSTDVSVANNFSHVHHSTANVSKLPRHRWRTIKRLHDETNIRSCHKKQRLDEQLTNQMIDFHISPTQSRDFVNNETNTVLDDKDMCVQQDEVEDDENMGGLRLHVHCDINRDLLQPQPVLPRQIIDILQKPCMALVLWKPVMSIMSTQEETLETWPHKPSHMWQPTDEDLRLQSGLESVTTQHKGDMEHALDEASADGDHTVEDVEMS